MKSLLNSLLVSPAIFVVMLLVSTAPAIAGETPTSLEVTEPLVTESSDKGTATSLNPLTKIQVADNTQANGDSLGNAEVIPMSPLTNSVSKTPSVIEPGVDNKLLQSLSQDLNLTLHPLDSLETGAMEPQHYFTAMKANLQTLEAACK